MSPRYDPHFYVANVSPRFFSIIPRMASSTPCQHPTTPPGNCGSSNCVASTSVAGENLVLEYPQLNHDETFTTQCGDGFVGQAMFRCSAGVATREWIRWNFIDPVASEVAGEDTIDSVELCECCLLAGVSSNTVGDGSLDLG